VIPPRALEAKTLEKYLDLLLRGRRFLLQLVDPVVELAQVLGSFLGAQRRTARPKRVLSGLQGLRLCK